MYSVSRWLWTLLIGTLFAALSLPAPALAQFGGRIRPPRPGMAMPAVRPPVVQEKLEVEGGIVVAFLNLDRSSIGTLIEARLRSKKIVNWWRRGATARLLDDLELSTAIDVPPPEDAGVAPLKLPDALILCRTRIQEKDRTCEIIVCEPGLGLRLGAVRLPLTKEVGTDVGKLADGTVKALAKLGEEMTELWGVPPLRSKDLGTKYDSLRTQLAGLVEEELLRRKGAQLVELEYAHAIALARKHAGVVEPLKRAAPIYFTGQYRNTGDGDLRTLAITLQVAGSEAETIQKLSATEISPAEAENALRQRVQAIAKEFGGSQEFSLKETTAEIGTLASLSKEFQKASDPQAQLAISEAILLLKPDDWLTAQATLKLLGAQTEAHFEPARDIVAYVHVTEVVNNTSYTKTVPSDKMELQLQEGLLAMNFHRRGLFRIRDTMNASDPVLIRQVDFSPQQFLQTYQGSVYRIETPRAFIAASQRLIAQQRELSLQLVRHEAKAGRAGALHGWSWTNSEEMMPVVLRLITELQDEPQAEMRTVSYVLNGIHAHNLKSPQGEVFLQQLAEIPNPAVQAALVKIKEQVAKYNLPPTTPPIAPPEPEEKDPDVRFVRLDLGWKDIPKEWSELRSICELVVPVGKDGDLFCSDGRVLMMKKKGETKLIFDATGQGYTFRQLSNYGIAPATACFDGKYAWLPMMSYGKASRLLVVDVEKEKATEFKADSGLPSEIPEKHAYSLLAAAPLGPGKAFLVGSFGKTWLGTATFDGEKGAVKIIHEAQEVPERNLGRIRDQWRSTSLRFSPSYLFALSDPAEKEKPASRMIIGRACEDAEAHSHPLLVDPESGKVTVMETPLNPGTAAVMGQHAGSLYWVQTSNSDQKFGAEFMRLGFPDFEPTSLGKQPLSGKGHMFAFGIEDKKLHFFHDQWLTAESPDQPLQVLKGKLPTNERNSPRFLMRSNHYGWVVIFSNNNRGYAVEFKK